MKNGIVIGQGIAVAVLAVLIAGAGPARGVTGADWAVDGDQAGAAFGEHVTVVGDVNGDGYSDVVIGAPLWGNIFRPEEGRAFLYLGSASGLAPTPAWNSTVNQAEAHYGSTVAAAGDVNGDGYDDVLVSAPDYSTEFAEVGLVNLFLGSPTGLSATPVWTGIGEQPFSSFGIGLAGIGDVNDDGYDDVAVGAPYYNNNAVANAGRVYVYLGSPAGLPAQPSTTREANTAYASFGVSVAGAGDVNADGIDDVIIGAYGGGTNAEGTAFVYLGTLFGMAQSPVWAGEGNQDNAYYGSSVAGVGDVNGDGYGDILVGAFLCDQNFPDEGAAFLYYGKSSGVESAAAWTKYAGKGGASYGRSVAPAGDMNGDGYADIVIGAPYYTISYADEGVIGIYYGSAGGPSSGADLIYSGGQESAFFGYSSATAGDVNGDGYGDVIAGAYSYDDGSPGEGEVFGFYGSAGDLPSLANWSISGTQADAHWGEALAFGDFNGDGFDDLASGAPCYDGGLIDEGRVGLSYGDPGGLSGGFDWSKESNVEGHLFGNSLAAADVDGDGIDDLLIGAPLSWSIPHTGRVYLYRGSSNGLSASPDLVLEDESTFGTSVANAGDVNGDGYLDVLVGQSTYNSFRGRVLLYYGSATGLNPTPAWSYAGGGTAAAVGSSLAGGGDVNADGYSDFLVGAPGFYGNTFAFFGGPNGPPAAPSWSHAGETDGSLFGGALAFGDFNADGRSDVVVGSPHYSGASSHEGRIHVYMASNGGINSSPAWTKTGGMDDAELGWSVATTDANNDGVSDLATAARGYTAGQDYEGKAYLYLGPLGAAPTWTMEGGHDEARLGNGLTGGGDIDGDGFTDLAISSPNLPSGLVSIGKVWLFQGGEGGGVVREVQQVRSDESAVVSLLGRSDSDGFRIRMKTRTPFGRDAVRVEYEIEPAGVPFDGQGIVTTAWLDTGSPGADGCVFDLSEQVSGLMTGAYQWRARVVSASPWFPRSPWFSPAGNAATEWDLRTGEGPSAGVQDSRARGGLSLELTGPNPFHASAELTYALTKPADVRITIFDAAGRQIASLVDGIQSAGVHGVRWDAQAPDGTRAPSGVYFARLQSGNVQQVVRLVQAR